MRILTSNEQNCTQGGYFETELMAGTFMLGMLIGVPLAFKYNSPMCIPLSALAMTYGLGGILVLLLKNI